MSRGKTGHYSYIWGANPYDIRICGYNNKTVLSKLDANLPSPYRQGKDIPAEWGLNVGAGSAKRLATTAAIW